MEISKKMDYALRILSEAAQVGEGEVISVREAAERNGIPYSFARSIQHELVKCGLLATSRGPRGGMTLAVDPRELTLLDVYRRINGLGEVDPNPDLREQEADARVDSFAMVWSGAERLIRAYLSSVTLHEVIVECKVPHLEDGYHFVATPVKRVTCEWGDPS